MTIEVTAEQRLPFDSDEIGRLLANGSAVHVGNVEIQGGGRGLATRLYLSCPCGATASCGLAEMAQVVSFVNFHQHKA